MFKLKKIRQWVRSHKKTSTLIVLVLVFAGYKAVQGWSSDTGETKYIISTARKGTLVSATTGTGQVSASNRVDVVSEVSGDVISVPVKLGVAVKKGQTIAQLDSRDAERAVENTELGLENVKFAYEKAKKQADDQAKDSSVSDLENAYDNGRNDVANAFIDLPDILEGMDAIIYDQSHSPYYSDASIRSSAGNTAVDYKYDAGRIFDQAKKDYEANLKTYKAASPSGDRDKIVALIDETHATIKKLSSALTGTYNNIDYIKARITVGDVPSEITADKNALNSYITKVNNHMTSLTSALTDIEDAKDSATEATLDLKSAQVDVNEAEDDLNTARENLANHSIKAPFEGIIGKVSVEAGDRITANSAVAVVITDEKIAEVSLNEVDIAKVKGGDKANITFDAVDGLTISGKVIEIDLLGTVEQGVVSYTVKIAFDANDDRVKTGMSLSASIVTDEKQDVLLVPNSAIKSSGNISYVEVLGQDLMQSQGAARGIASSDLPKRVPVEIGLSNDDYTEITKGLGEGDRFISRTITQSSTQTTASQAPSLFGGGGTVRSTGGTSGGSNLRIQSQTITR